LHLGSRAKVKGVYIQYIQHKKLFCVLRECHKANQVKQDNVDSVATGQATKDVIINEIKVRMAA